MLAFPTLGHCTELLTIIKAIAVTSAKIGGVGDYTGDTQAYTRGVLLHNPSQPDFNPASGSYAQLSCHI